MAEENENTDTPEEVSTEHKAQVNTPAESGLSGTELPGGEQKSENGYPEEGKGEEGTGQPEESTSETSDGQENKEGSGGEENKGEGTDEPEEHSESKGSGQGKDGEGKEKGSGSGEDGDQQQGDNKEEGEGGDGEGKGDPNKFQSLAVKIIKQICKTFSEKDKFPPNLDEPSFVFMHLPAAIYKTYLYIITRVGITREQMEAKEQSFDDLVALDRQLAKSILKQTQINPRYFDVENAYNNILFDLLEDIGAFQLENTIIKGVGFPVLAIYKTPLKLFFYWPNAQQIFSCDYNKKAIANFTFEESDDHVYTNYYLLDFIKQRTNTAEQRKENLSNPEENQLFIDIYKKQLKALTDAV